MSDPLVIVTEGEISTLLINRPAALNALNEAVLSEIEAAIARLQQNVDVRVISISGAGEKAFVAGADIRAMADKSATEMSAYIERGQQVMQSIVQCPVPVIAAVGGFALGGGLELALACDFIVASDRARVGLPEVSLGIIPGFGGTQRLIARAGIGAAKRVVLVGDILSAQQAYELRIVDEVVPHEELHARVQSLAESIASRGPLAVAAARKVMNSYASDLLLSGLKREVAEFMDLFESDDRKEGMQAFLEKRAAVFKGQ